MTTITKLKASLAALEAGDLLCELTAAELLRSVIAEMEAGEPVAWFKHGPYEDGEPLVCVFEDPHDEDCFSALVYQVAQPKAERSKCVKCGDKLMSDLTDTCFSCNQPKNVPEADFGNMQPKAEPVQEPVAWWVVNKTTDEKFVTTRPYDWNNVDWVKHPLYAQPKAEPADMGNPMPDAVCKAEPVQEPKLPEFFSGVDVGKDGAVAISILMRRADDVPMLVYSETFAAPQAKPLTNERRSDICYEVGLLDFGCNFEADIGKVIDLVEAAHGIASKDSKGDI